MVETILFFFLGAQGVSCFWQISPTEAQSSWKNDHCANTHYSGLTFSCAGTIPRSFVGPGGAAFVAAAAEADARAAVLVSATVLLPVQAALTYDSWNWKFKV